MTILEKLSMRVFYAMYAFEALILPNNKDCMEDFYE